MIRSLITSQQISVDRDGNHGCTIQEHWSGTRKDPAAKLSNLNKEKKVMAPTERLHLRES